MLRLRMIIQCANEELTKEEKEDRTGHVICYLLSCTQTLCDERIGDNDFDQHIETQVYLRQVT